MQYLYNAPRSSPFFAARRTPSGARVEGDERVRLGHKIDLGPGREADGIFGHWTWDGRTLVVENDRYGMYPLFYSMWGGEIRISPSIRHVLDGAFPKTLDFAALAVFQRLGIFLADDTPFEHVRALPPGVRLVWSDEKSSVESRFVGESCTTPKAGNFDEAVDQYANLFAQAIRRRAPPDGRFDLAISGGRDSRHIFLELLAQGHTPERAVTVQGYPPIDDEDRVIARRLAQATGQPHDEVDYPRSYVDATLQDIDRTEFCASGHTWLDALVGYFSYRGTKCIFDGIGGDVLSAGHTLTEQKQQLLVSGQTSRLAEHLLGESGNEGFIQSCSQAGFQKRISRSVAIERLDAELGQHRSAANPLLSFVFWNRTRRCVGLVPFGLLRDVETVFCPYLDHDLFDFLMGLDPAYARQGLHDETIRRSYPEYADIPYECRTTTTPGQRELDRYYRKAARETLVYLARNPGLMRSRLVRTGRFAAMLARSAVATHPGKLWYLQPLLRRLEMERAAGGIDGL
ncbi:asparagine synthetase B family protein [Thioalkalivibrio sp. ALMg11]|uniref:asparagine synthase family protein n=1 Tax=Thioalkalivibrio sp. ALMg11 TaxID=1158165 RepID=UPI00037182A2|nr:asparagine synthetase B family protein [Thioalkalivibrio sp. ALMg11]